MGDKCNSGGNQGTGREKIFYSVLKKKYKYALYILYLVEMKILQILLSKKGSVINQKLAGESAAVVWMDVITVAKIQFFKNIFFSHFLQFFLICCIGLDGCYNSCKNSIF